MPSDGGATTDELFIVICPSERHNPPGPWRSAPASYADARRLDLQHGMDWGLGHEDTRIETYEAQDPPPLPVPPAPRHRRRGSTPRSASSRSTTSRARPSPAC